MIGGIPWEFVQRLESMGGAFIEWPKTNIDFDIELYKLCCQRMVLEAGAAAAQSIAEGRNVQESISRPLWVPSANSAQSFRNVLVAFNSLIIIKRAMSWCLIPHHEIALLIDRQLVTRHWLIMSWWRVMCLLSFR